VDAVWLVKRSQDAPHITEIQRVDDREVGQVIQELGIKPSYNFDADAVVFIEDKLGAPIYDIWARREGFGGRIQFIGAEGWNNMDYFANAKIIASRRVNTKVFVIFDGDTERGQRNKQIKKRLVAELKLPEGHIFTLAQSEQRGIC
jgi:hypothetical protein